MLCVCVGGGGGGGGILQIKDTSILKEVVSCCFIYLLFVCL